MTRHRELLLFEWVVVDNCNLNCSYCVNKGEYSQKPKSEMLYAPGLELDIARKIVALSSNAERVVVNLTGGDPLLSKHFVELLTILASAGNIQIRLITNMKLLKNVADRICEIYPDMMIGGSIHAQYRSNKEIDQLADFLKEYKGKLNITLSQVDCDLSPEDRSKVTRLSEKTGMSVDFQRFIPPWTEAGKVDDAQRISDENFAPSFGKRCCLGYSHFLLLPDGSFCYDLWCLDRTAKVGDFLSLTPSNLKDYILEDMKWCPKSSCGCNYNLFNHSEYLAACHRLGYSEAEIFVPENLRQFEVSKEKENANDHLSMPPNISCNRPPEQDAIFSSGFWRLTKALRWLRDRLIRTAIK